MSQYVIYLSPYHYQQKVGIPHWTHHRRTGSVGRGLRDALRQCQGTMEAGSAKAGEVVVAGGVDQFAGTVWCSTS